MNTAQRIAKNAGVLLTANIINRIVHFFYVMYTARYLGASGFGILSFALAYTGIFAVLTDFGLRQLTIREVARDKTLAGKYLINTVVMKLILVAITFGLIVLTINLAKYPGQQVIVVYIIGLSFCADTFTGSFYSIFQAYEKMEYQSIGDILSGVLMLAGALFAIALKFDIVGFAYIYAIVSVTSLGYAFAVYAWRFLRPRIEIDFRFWKSTIIQAFPFGLCLAFVVIYYWIDSVMLSFMKGDAEVGLYNVAYRLITIPLIVPNIISAAVFPSMSRFFISSRDALHFITGKYFKLMLALGIPIGVGTTLLADKIIITIFGSEYANSAAPLRLLIWAVVFIFVNTPFFRLLESANRQTVAAAIVGVGMIVNVVFNLLIIPRFSYIGAAFTRVLTEFIIAILAVIFAYRTAHCGVQKGDFLTHVFRPVIAGLIMGIYLWSLPNLNLIILVLSSALLYAVVLYMVGGIGKEDIRLLRGTIKLGKC
jgi:O-antigen/teichoic acid export membrane protein